MGAPEYRTAPLVTTKADQPEGILQLYLGIRQFFKKKCNKGICSGNLVNGEIYVEGYRASMPTRKIPTHQHRHTK